MKTHRTIPVTPAWREAIARLAAASGVSVPVFLARAEIDEPAPLKFICGACERPIELIGHYPAPPVREANDPLGVRMSLRIFEGGLLEVHGLDQDDPEPSFFCPGCAKHYLEPVGRVLAMLAPDEAEAMGEHNKVMGSVMGFVRGLLSKKDPQAAKSALPSGDAKQKG